MPASARHGHKRGPVTSSGRPPTAIKSHSASGRTTSAAVASRTAGAPGRSRGRVRQRAVTGTPWRRRASCLTPAIRRDDPPDPDLARFGLSRLRRPVAPSRAIASSATAEPPIKPTNDRPKTPRRTNATAKANAVPTTPPVLTEPSPRSGRRTARVGHGARTLRATPDAPRCQWATAARATYSTYARRCASSGGAHELRGVRKIRSVHGLSRLA
jgi:hypothetical protein